jgi:hypothetical protein
MVAVMSLALVAGLVGPAHAAKVTVASNGSPDLSKMVVINGQKAVVVKLYGTGGKHQVRWSYVHLKGTDGVLYEARAAWGQATWYTRLSRGSSMSESGGTAVNCPGFKYTWNATGKFWRVFVPRSCLGKLTNKIKVYAEHVAQSAMPGAAGWSRWVARG